MSPSPRVAMVIVAALYGVIVLAIGVWAARRTRSPRDFFIAGRRLGVVVASLAMMSAAFSGFVFIGGPGLTLRLGAGALMIVVPVGVTAGMVCWIVGRPLHRIAGSGRVLTVPDAVREHFGSEAAAGLAALSIVVGSVAYLGLQVRVLGVVIESFLGTGAVGPISTLATSLALLVVLVYSAAGGMLAGVYTDLLQGILMLVTAVLVFGVAMTAPGGPVALVESIAGAADLTRTFFDPLGRADALTAFGFFFVFGVGVLGQPHMLHKFFMLRDERTLALMPLAVGISQSLCLLLWIGIGFAVPALVVQGRMEPPGVPDAAAPLFLITQAPALLAGLALAGVLAAIMSSVDSFVNIASAALVRDLPRVVGLRIERELLWGRVATVVLLLAAALLSWAYGDLVAILGTFAFGSFAAALAPSLAVGLNWERVSARAALASMGTGLAVHLGLEFWQRISPETVPTASGAMPAAVALAASFTVLFAVALVERPGHCDPSSREACRASA